MKCTGASKSRTAILVGACCATALVVGLVVGFTVNSGKSEDQRVEGTDATPPMTTPVPPMASTTSSAITTTSTESNPSTPITSLPKTSESVTQGPRNCLTELLHPKLGTGRLPNTTGEVWRSTQCPSAGKPKCPSGVDSPVILVSVDGFRADYMLRKLTPNIQRMADCGAHAPYMRAAFPTKTFPNHYTLVTGLYPESHGIIDNSMFDIKLNKRFYLSAAEKFEGHWWFGEPIWNTAMKEGKKVVPMFWPGSDAPIQEMRPDVCYVYNGSVTYQQRVSEILSHFDGDVADFPMFSTLYFEQPDSAGHFNNRGPFGETVNTELAAVDGIIGKLMDGLVERKLEKCVNVIIVADHGMSPVSCSSSYKVYLNSYHDSSDYYVYQGVHGRISSKYKPGASSSDPPIIVDNPESPEDIVEHYKCTKYDNTKDWYTKFYTKQDLPKRYHYANNHRIDDVIIDVEKEYGVYRARSGSSCLRGNHGYDNSYKSMHALFVAHGPSFKHQPAMQMFESIEVYNLLAELMHLNNPASNNGTLGRLHNILHFPRDLPSQSLPKSTYLECGFPEAQETRDARRSNSDCECGIVPGNMAKTLDELDLQLHLNSSMKDLSREKNTPMGKPELSWTGASVCELVQKDYISGYSHQIKMPIWASFKLNESPAWSEVFPNFQHRTDLHARSKCLRVDVRLTISEQTKCKDYNDTQQGISYGFLYPPGFSNTIDMMFDGHISTNIVPMYDGFRDGVWRDTMILIEGYTEKYGELHVTLGPIFDYNADGLADTAEQIQANASFVGNATVPIPTHYFVSIVRVNPLHAKDSDNIEDVLTNYHVMSIILPHKPDIGNCMDRRIFEYQTENAARVADIAQLTGLTIFPDLGNPLERVRLLTYLPERLWDKYGWMDLHGKDGKDSCPDISAVQCPAGYNLDDPPLVLISIDGFRPDYMDYKLTPVLERMGRCGVSTPYMRSVYPTLTFPNHYTQVTGLYPESTGIIDNNMYDMDLEEFFSLGSTASLSTDWWKGEPLWNTFMKNNKTAMAMFWAGSEVEIGGMRPTEWVPYNGNYPDHLRVTRTLDWLSGKDSAKANFITLYFSKVDSTGHDGGPGSPELKEAVANTDELFRQLMDGIYQRGLLKCINLVVVSDHGMSDIACDRQEHMIDYMPSTMINNMYVYQGAAGRISTKYRRSGSSYIHIDPEDQNDQQEVIDKLTCVHPTFGIFHKRDLPIRNHYANNDRIDDIIFRAIDRHMLQRYSSWCPIIGYHQWDPKAESMKAFFSSYGVGFKSGFRAETFENIELYNLLTYLGGLTPAPNNGTEGAMYHILRHEPSLPEKAATPYRSSVYPNSQEVYERRSNLTNVGCQCVLGEGLVEDYDQRINMSTTDKSLIEMTHLSNGRPGYVNSMMSELSVLHHKDFVSGYWSRPKMALWTAFTLAASQVLNLTEPENCLRPDVRLEPDEQASCDEYNLATPLNISSGSFFPTDFGSTEESRLDTRLLTNAVPMYTGFKDGVWKALLDHLVIWAKDFRSIQVYTGPVFDHNMDGRMDHNMTEFVGDSELPLPSHFYVVIVKCPDTKCHLDGDYDMQAFVIPHRQNISNCMTTDEFLADHVARVRDVELLTDLEFPPYTQVALRRKTFTPMTIWDQQRLG